MTQEERMKLEQEFEENLELLGDYYLNQFFLEKYRDDEIFNRTGDKLIYRNAEIRRLLGEKEI